MKALVTGLILAFSLGNVYAQQCGSATTRLNQTELSSVLSGNTVCASFGSDKWQEYHAPGGALIDYKKGASDPVDPTVQVGNWAITGTGSSAMVTHTYGGTPYSFAVYANKVSGNFIAPFDFCGPSPVTNATILSGPVGCGF